MKWTQQFGDSDLCEVISPDHRVLNKFDAFHWFLAEGILAVS